jgi:Ca2+-binding RTX toxin-like protein
VYGADRIYPADHYAEPYIYCGYYGGIYWYVTIDHRFWGVYDPCDDYYFDVTFPADATMEIWGDGGTISGGTADWLYGWDNADYIRGGGGGDLIHGAAGNDSMNGDYGGDTIYGDTCSSGTEYFQGGGDAGSDKLYGATGGCDAHMYGGDGGDELHGTDQGDVLDGEAGWKDHVLGYGGNDELWGGSGGDDICDGGNDTDTCHACCEPPLYNCEP